MAENFLPTEQQLDRTREFINDKIEGNSSYVPFSIINGKRYLWCIHPTDEDVDSLRVAVQTPGGAYGEGLDAAITASNISGELISPVDALKEDIDNRKLTTILALHQNCAFAGAVSLALAEMADPSNITEESIEEWMYQYKVGKSKDRQGLIYLVREGAAAQRDNLTSTTIEDMALRADQCSPYHTHTGVKGVNQARMYVVNHLPHLGLNRQALHREQKLDVQFYHDSLGAEIWDARNINHQGNQRHAEKMRTLRITSIIARSAAARTLLSFPEPVGLAAQPNELYEIHAGEFGPVVNRLEPDKTNSKKASDKYHKKSKIGG